MTQDIDSPTAAERGVALLQKAEYPERVLTQHLEYTRYSGNDPLIVSDLPGGISNAVRCEFEGENFVPLTPRLDYFLRHPQPLSHGSSAKHFSICQQILLDRFSTLPSRVQRFGQSAGQRGAQKPPDNNEILLPAACNPFQRRSL